MENYTLYSDLPIHIYFREIAKCPHVTYHQERALAMRIQQGDQGALKELIDANLRHVIPICKRYVGMGVNIEDLVSAANVALIKAAQRFESTNNQKFIEFASWWIRQELMAEFARIGRTITIPAQLFNKGRKLQRKIDKLEQHNGSYMTAEEAAQKLGMPIEEVHELLSMVSKDESLDAPVQGAEDPNMTMVDMVVYEDDKGPEEETLHNIISEQLAEAMMSLTPRERDILRLTFGIGSKFATIEEAAIALNITPNKLRVIRKHAIHKLRDSKILRDLS